MAGGAFVIATPSQADLVLGVFNPVDLTFSELVVLGSLGLPRLAAIREQRSQPPMDPGS